MDIRQLSYFVAVADKGTVIAAAVALHMSQPPLSAQIKSLEQELGCKLFDRNARRMHLTDAGRTLYERACGILDLCTSAKNEMADLKTGTAGTLRLGVASSVVSTVFPAWLDRFCASRGRLRFELYEADTYRLLDKIRSNQIELAVVRTPFSAPDLNCVHFRNEPLCAVGQRKFFGGSSDGPIGLSALAGVPLLFYRRWEVVLTDLFRQNGFRPKVFCVSDDARTTVRLAEGGFGAGLVPQSAVSTDTACSVHEIEHPGLHSEICVVYRKDVYVSAAVKCFIESIRSECGHGANRKVTDERRGLISNGKEFR